MQNEDSLLLCNSKLSEKGNATVRLDWMSNVALVDVSPGEQVR